MEFLFPYKMTIWVIGSVGLLLLLQLIVLDIAILSQKHIPGFTIEANHECFLFRANRALANSNESLGIFIVFVLFALFSQPIAHWINGFAVVYLFGRIGHMLCYYFNMKILRSIFFVVSLLGLIGLFVTAVMAWL
ncbi:MULTISPECIES: MAPEG family protein [unclassified Photobacterium]|uniref:MAPEG family protein n=1 Tax=unclassified Photobacterium TaxID=2628852 RepID=UPI001EDEA29A|nr:MULTISPECIES: MAPEG family protein [unclassified Photobacterium]MCG3864494.1 MAPEG family protein [Photobacterium sp. Ph6]MCG3876613.1 MAPEG family protein [Photobacterium sp. Ph5]